MFLSQPKFKSSRAPRKNALKIDVGLISSADHASSILPQTTSHPSCPSAHSTGGLALPPLVQQSPPQTPDAVSSDLSNSNSGSSSKKKMSLRVTAPASSSFFPPRELLTRSSSSLTCAPGSSMGSSLSRSGGPFVLDRREQIAAFRGVCSEILPSIFMGDEVVSSNYQLLKEKGITHILNCAATSIPNSFPFEFCYESIELLDCPTEDISGLFYTAISFIDDAVNLSNGKVLVHCKCGISRSSALVLCYMMYTLRLDYSSALSRLKTSRPVCEPNAGYALSLMNWFNMLQESASSTSSSSSSSSPSSSPPSSSSPISSFFSSSPPSCASGLSSLLGSSKPKVQAYKIEPMSAQNPLLTSKLISAPFDSSLLSRLECALLKTPSMLYIWIGENCSDLAVECAQRFAQLLQRYEDASGTIQLINHPSQLERILTSPSPSPSSPPPFSPSAHSPSPSFFRSTSPTLPSPFFS